MGVRHCTNHEKNAIHDVHTFLHTNKLVRVSDALSHPKIRPLLEVFTKGVSLPRTNGTFDPGWRLIDNMMENPNLIQKLDGEWFCVVYKLTEVGEVARHVPFATIVNHPGMEERLPSNYKSLVQTALTAMEEGIYCV